MTHPTNAPAGTDSPDKLARLPLWALLSSLVVGPLGVGLGVWSVADRRRAHTKVPGLAIAAIALGLVQTVAVASWAAGGPGLPGADPTPLPASTPWTYPTTPPPSAPVDPVPSETPTKAPPSSIGEVMRPTVGPYEAKDFSEDKAAVEKGAVAAQTGTFTSSDETIGAAFSQWPTEAAAAAHARAAGNATYGPDALRGSGSYSSGDWWYYELDGKGTVYWTDGTISSSFTGDPYEVQDFFLGFPK